MRTLAVAILFAVSAFPQTAAEPATTRGVLLERDASPAGEFSLRASDNHVLRYRYDAGTKADREGQSLDVPRLRPGDHIEVISEAAADDPLPHARTVHVSVPVATPVTAHRPATPGRLRPFNAQEERLLPKGDLSFSGVIVSLNGSRLILRTRAAGEQTIVLRTDTRYVENGELAPLGSLRPTMRVFVRGARNFQGDVEGYQVMWGNILEVR